MAKKGFAVDEKLTRREREIMDIVLQAGEVTVEDVRRRLSDPPSYSTARAMLSRLEAKGYVRHREQGPRYIYRAAISRRKARETAARRLVDVFYKGSLAKAVVGLVEGERLSDDDLREIEGAIADARRSTKKPKGRS